MGNIIKSVLICALNKRLKHFELTVLFKSRVGFEIDGEMSQVKQKLLIIHFL